ncbi:MAG: MGMT family protein [Hyphomicrobium sp.]
MAIHPKAELLALVRKIPLGRVASVEAIAEAVGAPVAVVQTLLSQLDEDDRDVVPWHRVVKKGGAIGRGPHRDQQFARLVREGVAVSPAGIVQDLARQMLFALDDASLEQETAVEKPQASGRSRGMKQRP